MEAIYFLIPLALLLLAVFVAAFLWAVKSEQFEDLDREAHRILFDEDKPTHNPTDVNKALTSTPTSSNIDQVSTPNK